MSLYNVQKCLYELNRDERVQQACPFTLLGGSGAAASGLVARRGGQGCVSLVP